MLSDFYLSLKINLWHHSSAYCLISSGPFTFWIHWAASHSLPTTTLCPHRLHWGFDKCFALSIVLLFSEPSAPSASALSSNIASSVTVPPDQNAINFLWQGWWCCTVSVFPTWVWAPWALPWLFSSHSACHYGSRREAGTQKAASCTYPWLSSCHVLHISILHLFSHSLHLCHHSLVHLL